jgi:hypothetical protein
MRIRPFHLERQRCERVDQFRARAAFEAFQGRFRTRSQGGKQALVSARLNLAKLRMWQTFGEIPYVSRQRCFIAVGRVAGLRRPALKQSSGFTKA